MKQQMVARTYPNGYTNPNAALIKALNEGWLVVMANPFDVGNGKKGTEYILEKSVKK